MTNKEKAFLDVIAYAEGTIGFSNNGYDIVVGNRKIIGWTENTNIVHGNGDWRLRGTNSNGQVLNSSAAGRYQFTYATWLEYNGAPNKPLTKSNQDKRALDLIKTDIKGVDFEKLTQRNIFDSVVTKMARRWVSFPKGSDQKYTSAELFQVFNEALALYGG